MKQQCRVVFVALLALLRIPCAPVLAQGSLQANAARETNEAIDRWAKENYGRALDLVFQDRCTSPTGARWLCRIRIVPGFPEEIEYSLSMEKRYDGTILARITRPRAQSVYTQLCKRKQEHPHASVADLTKLIELESQAGDQQRFPGLLRLAQDFENVRLTPALSDEITMDATEYIFRVRSFSGDQLELTVRGPGSAAPRQPQTLIQWAESAREMLSVAFHDPASPISAPPPRPTSAP